MSTHPPLIDGLVATTLPDHTQEQWTTTGAHRLTRGDIIDLTRTGPIQPAVVLAVEPRADKAGRDVIHITARNIGTGKDVHETRPANASFLARCDLRYEPACDDPDDEDGGMTAADFFGDGVYQPETDPQKIAAAEQRLNKLRARFNQPAW